MKPKALVLSGDGINCSNETRFALELAGFEADMVHTSDLLENGQLLFNYKLLALPGGFSFGDEIASGKVLAVKMRHRMLDALHSYIDKDNLVLGICNGFQILVQLGLLPNSDVSADPTVSLTHNIGGKFINRWVEMKVNSHSIFFKDLDKISLPIRHGEGRLRIKAGAKNSDIEAVRKQTALNYLENVNGSFEKIAGLLNSEGNVLGLMPHPEAYIHLHQHPAYQFYRRQTDNSFSLPEVADGLAILMNAAEALN
jgi:phosphoribosylformylglycinamidine synthase subunit PurQ / glutaminase